MPVTIDFAAPIDVQIAQARAQNVVIPEVFYQLPAEKRVQAFTVSGLAGLDQVQAVADAFARMAAEGGTLGEFQKWAAGQDWSLPRHRLETAYRNAVQTAYQAGHWRAFDESAEDLPYLMYDAINDSRVRPSHLALDGVIRPVNDPFWKTHSPPLGNRCRCTLRQMTREQAQRKGGVTQNPPAEGQPDPGWGSDPRAWGETLRRIAQERLNQCKIFGFAKKRAHQPMWCSQETYAGILLRSMEGYSGAGGAMPAPRMPQGIERLSSSLKEEELFRRFMREFDGSEFTDVIGNQLLIGRELFENIQGQWKIMRGERAQWLLYTALNIKMPDEIWKEKGRHGAPDRLHYLSRLDVGRRGILSCVAVFERGQGSMGSWIGRTNYATTRDDGYIENKRKREEFGLRYWRWEQ